MSTAPANSEVLTIPSEDGERAAAEERRSYSQILKSSALIGGSQVLTIAIGIIRTKVMAILLGPSGVGLMGLYGSISDLAVSVAGMGVNSSGVRQIAEAVGSGDTHRIARTAAVLQRTSVILGLLGALLLLCFSAQISTLTFGTTQRTAGVSLLSIAVLCRLVSAGQGALIQGMRRISDLAKMGILGAVFGLVISIPLIYFLREDGVVPSLVGVAAMTILTSWWYSRKIDVPPASITTSQVGQEASDLLKLGFAFMASGLMMMGSAYVVRIIIRQKLGVEATGFYHAAWALSGLYAGFILQAMAADFYPRLTASANDDMACNRIVNQQTRVAILLAVPGLIATITFAPLVIQLMYSAKFTASIGLLRWMCLGVMLKVVAWPMGFIILAKAHRRMFIGVDLAYTIVHVGLARLCVDAFGIDGVGVAFAGSYLFHCLFIHSVVRRYTRFSWSQENRAVGLMLLPVMAIIFSGLYLFPSGWSTSLGVLGLLVSGAYSSRVLLNIMRAGPQVRYGT